MITPVAELYANFRLLGVVVGYVILGLWYGFLYRRCFNNHADIPNGTSSCTYCSSSVVLDGERNLLDVPALLQRHLGQSRGALGFRHGW